jgi:hypothetical protein
MIYMHIQSDCTQKVDVRTDDQSYSKKRCSWQHTENYYFGFLAPTPKGKGPIIVHAGEERSLFQMHF